MSTTLPLKRVARIDAGQSPPSSEVSDLSDGLPFLQGNAEFGREHPEARFECSTSPKRSLAGDILLSVRAPVGALNIADRPYGIGRGLASIRVRDADERFTWWWLHSQRHFLDAVSTGTTYRAVTAEDVGRLHFPRINIDEQRRIADFLDGETARIDQLSANQHRMIDVLEERRVAVTSHFAYGRDCDVDKQESTIPTIGPIPSTWLILRNKTFMREVTDLSDTGEEQLLSVSHLTGVTPRSEKDVNMFLAESTVGYKRCKPGDLIINTLWAWMGALGVSRYSGIMSPAYGIYRMTSDAMNEQYFDYLVRTPEYVTEMTRFSKGVWTSRLRLYPESFLALSVPVPPRSEQAQIVQQIVSETVEQERLKSKLDSFANTLRERRQALITAAVTRQIDVTTARGLSEVGGVKV